MSSEQPLPAQLLQLIVGRWVSTAIGVAARLALADALSEGPRSPEALAERVGADAPTLRRLLRALASVGVFAEDAEGCYRNTPLSEQLQTKDTSLRAFALMAAHPALTRAWDDLFESVRTGEPAFARVNGEPLFQYLETNADLGSAFNQAMTSRGAMELDAILERFDVRGAKTLVDVGGGHGLLVSRLLERDPALRAVLYDLPGVVAGAGALLAASGVASRVDVQPGSFFEHVPSGGDTYVLKRILHDWGDDDAKRILAQVHRAAASGSRLFVLDAVMAPGNAPDFAKLLDLQMLVFTTGGRERTRPEWEALLDATGFTLERVVDTKAPIAILEARRR